MRNIWTNEEARVFKNNLKQVMWWTELLTEHFDYKTGNYGTVFRQTNPEINGSKLYQMDNGYATWQIDDYSYETNNGYTTWQINDYSYDLYDQLLQSAISVRPEGPEINPQKIHTFGRILSFETLVTTRDGAPIIESKLFLDESDVPPIDTWFFLKRNYTHTDHACKQSLFCWIPKPFQDVMQQGIDVEILDSYRWMDENEPAIFKHLLEVL